MEKRVSYRIKEEEEGISLGELLSKKGLTKRQISAAKFRESGICLDGRQTRVTCLVHAGQRVEVRLETDAQASRHLIPVEGPLTVLYEDEDLIAVDKPAGMAVHPSGVHYQDTVANVLAGYFAGKQESVRIRAVGRLDRETSGILIFAKNQIAAARLAEQKKNGSFYKEYLALVEGRFPQKEGMIASPIGRGEGIRMRVEPEGKQALTKYLVWKEGDSGGEALCALRVRIETGRTHQIRVHMASIGHPLLGDALYGGRMCGGIGRTALHARKAALLQPFTGKELCLEAKIPEDMISCFPMIM